MRRVLALAALVLLTEVAPTWSDADGAALAITAPAEGAGVVGETLIDVAVTSASTQPTLVTIYVDGRELCSRERKPWSCRWNAGEHVRERHIRVVATFADGRRLVATRRTKGLDVTESVRVMAIQVPVLVTRSGRYVTGLSKADFAVLEDGRNQRIDSLIDDSLPLELVIAVDVSASMEPVMPQVREAVTGLLDRLRPGDTTTLVGFNDTIFVLADGETDPELRAAAVEGLLPWGGTALYDAMIRSIDLVRVHSGRRGVIVFSDGDDRNSITSRDEAKARIEESQVMLYTVGFGRGTSDQYRQTLTAFAEASGGRALFPLRMSELESAFSSILEELSHQYVLSYVSTATDRRDWRRLDVKARCEGCRVRAREGYRVPED